jgi:hypothetical protein
VGDELGVDVAIHGGVILAGASFDDVGVSLNQGSAYVFLRPLGGWSGAIGHSAQLVASDGRDGDLFGSRVAIAGGSLVVSAPYADVTRDNQGAAYVFNLPISGWTGTLTEDAKLTAGVMASINANFGGGLAAVGETIVFGECSVSRISPARAPCSSARLAAGRRAVSRCAAIRVRRRTDRWMCGGRVRGWRILVGAVLADVNGAVDQGAAYRYRRPDGGWVGSFSETEKIVADDGVAGDRTVAVAFSGELAVVSALQRHWRRCRPGPRADLRARPPLTVQVEGDGVVTCCPRASTAGRLQRSRGRRRGDAGRNGVRRRNSPVGAAMPTAATAASRWMRTGRAQPFATIVMFDVASASTEGRVTNDPAGTTARRAAPSRFVRAR